MPARIKSLTPGVSAGIVVGQAQSYARTVANRPANVINPPALAKTAQDLIRGLKTVSCTIFDEKKLQASRMGGILAVGSGSQSKPRLIVLKYTPGEEAGPGAADRGPGGQGHHVRLRRHQHQAGPGHGPDEVRQDRRHRRAGDDQGAWPS